jgi:hypothetical protein
MGRWPEPDFFFALRDTISYPGEVIEVGHVQYALDLYLCRSEWTLPGARVGA